MDEDSVDLQTTEAVTVSDDALTIEKFEIETTVEIAKSNDGMEVLKQTIIDIDGEDFILVPLSIYENQLQKCDRLR